MRKNKIAKIMLVLLITITSFFNITMNVKAETVPNTINVTTTEPTKGYIGVNVNFGTKSLPDGSVAYCLDYNKLTTLTTVGTLVGEMDAGMTYIIENGYPNKSITGDNSKDYYITQTAIWWYLDETKGATNLDNNFKTTDEDPHNLRGIIKGLVDNAIVAKNKGYKKPTMSVVEGKKTLSITSDKKYYVSDEIKVNLTDLENYTVSLTDAPEGSFTTDKTGNKKTTFNIGETFRVYVPTEKTTTKKSAIKLAISANTTINKVYEYAPPDAKEQNLLPAILHKTPITLNQNLELAVASSVVTINKIDASTNNPLKDAILIIKDKDGHEIEKFTTTEEAHTIYNLPNGTYTITEIKAPAGYVLSEETYTFTIDDDNREINVTFKNYPAIEVPDTNSNSSIMMYILGALMMISGMGYVVCYAKKQK